MGVLTPDALAEIRAAMQTIYSQITATVRREISHWAGMNMRGGKWLGPSVTLATTSVVGVVKADGTTITVDGTGQITAVGGGGGIASFSFNPKTADYTITTSDTGISVDASGGAVTISVPTAVGAAQQYTIKRVDTTYANTVSIGPVVPGETFEFLSALTLIVQGHSVVLGSDGANWLVASSHYPDPGTTLGDVVVIDANGVPQRLPVGADTTRVTANSGATLGVDYEP